MMKRFLSAILILSFAQTGTLVPLGEAYAAEQPVLVEQSESRTVWQNKDGSRLVRATFDMNMDEPEPADPSSEEAWVDQGESWQNAGVIAQVELHKTYKK